jgi:hypothetical protein
VFEPLCRWRDRAVVEPGLFAGWTADAEGAGVALPPAPWRALPRRRACTAEDAVEAIRQHSDGLDMFGMPWPYARYLRAR